MQSDPDRLLFVGPRHWHARKQTVRMSPEPVRLLATGRTRAFLSRNVERLTGGRRQVEMRPATQLVIEWVGGAGTPAAVAEVRIGTSVSLIALERRLLAHGPWRVPGFAGLGVVPRGQGRITVLDGRTGAVLRRQSLTLRQGIERVLVQR